MACWTFFVALGTFFSWSLCWMSAGSMIDEEIAQGTAASCRDVTTGGVLLALAPWIVIGILGRDVLHIVVCGFRYC